MDEMGTCRACGGGSASCTACGAGGPVDPPTRPVAIVPRQPRTTSRHAAPARADSGERAPAVHAGPRPTRGGPAAAAGAGPGTAVPAFSGPAYVAPSGVRAAAPPGWERTGASRRVAAQAWTPAAFLAGDWLGAVAAVVTGLGTMIVLATASVLLLGVTDLPQVTAGTVVAAIAMVVALAFGGSVSASASGELAGSTLTGGTGVQAAPLLITLVGLLVLCTVVVRRLRRARAGLVGVVTQGVRVWVLLCAALALVCLAGRVSFGGSAAIGLEITTGFAGTLVGATVWLVVSLVVAVAWRLPTVLPARARRLRYAAAGPVAGAGVAVAVGAVLLLAGGGTAALLDGSSAGATAASGPGPGRALVVALLFAPNLLLAAFGLATGAPLSLSADAGASGLTAGLSRSLLDAAQADPQVWLAPLAVAVAVVVGGVVTALHAPDVGTGRRWSWLMGVALAVGLGAAAVATTVSVDGALVSATVGGTAHLHLLLAPLAGLVWGAVGGSLGALLAPVLPPSLVQGLRRHVLGARHRAFGIPVPAPRGPVPAPTRSV